MANQNDLERGWVKYRLMRALAEETKQDSKLAVEYGCARSSIHAFKERHRDEIASIRERLDDEFAELWAASKRNRIGGYQDQMTMYAQMIADEVAKGDAADKKLIAQLGREIRAASRHVAEELGDLKTTVAFDASVLRIHVGDHGELDEV